MQPALVYVHIHTNLPTYLHTSISVCVDVNMDLCSLHVCIIILLSQGKHINRGIMLHICMCV